MKSWKTFKKELLKNEKFAKEYRKLEPQYAVISQMINLRTKKGITQKELAEKIGTKQSAIARLESGNFNPTLDFLQKTAKALGTKLIINFE